MNSSDSNFFITKKAFLTLFISFASTLLFADQFSFLDQSKDLDSIDFTSAMASIEASHPSISQQNDSSIYALNKEVSKTPIHQLDATASISTLSGRAQMPDMQLKNLSPLQLQALETDIKKNQDPSFLYSNQNIFLASQTAQTMSISQDPMAAQATLDAQAAPPLTTEDVLAAQNNESANLDSIIGSLSGVGGFFAMALGTGFIGSLFTGGSPAMSASSNYPIKPVKSSYGAANNNLGYDFSDEAYSDPAKAYAADPLRLYPNIGASAYPVNQLRPASSTESEVQRIRRY